MNVILIRHAESESNAGLPTQSPTDTNVTPKGNEQSLMFAQKYERSFPKPDLIVTSKYVRTKQTAEPFRALFPEVPHEQWAVEEFTYLDTSRYNGTTFDQREGGRKSFWERSDPTYRDGNTAESFSDLIFRVDELFDQLYDRQLKVHYSHTGSMRHETVAIFTHGQFMRALVWRTVFGHMGVTPDSMRHFRQFDGMVPVPNTTILPITVAGGRPFVGTFLYL